MPFALAVMVSAAAGWLVFLHLVLPGRPPHWDEAAHALQGALVAQDVRELDLLSLLFDTYRQVYWPPLHSWLVGGAFLVAGESIEVARAVSVLAYVLLAPTLFLVARTVKPARGVLAGGVAALLALTSPGMIRYASEAMLEMPGMLAIAATILVHSRLERNPGGPPAAHALLGVTVVLTYLVKSSYGVLLLLTIASTKLIAAGFRPRRLWTRRNLYAVLPLAVFGAIWFAYPPKVVSTWEALVNRPWGGEAARGIRGLWYYPRAMADFSGSWWMCALLWGGLVAAWRSRARPGIDLLVALPLVLLLIGSLHHTKLPRHILPVFPALFALAGIAAADLWGRLGSRGRSARAAALGVLAGLALLHGSALARRDGLPADRPMTEVLAHVSRLVREEPPVLVVSTNGPWPQPPVIDWHLMAVEGVLPVTATGTGMDPRQERRLAAAIGGLPAPLRAGAGRVLGRYDEPAAVRSLHVGERYAEGQAEFEAFLEETLERGRTRSIVAVIGTADTTRFPAGFVTRVPLRAGFRLVSVREFPDAGTEIRVYRRR